MKLDSGSLPVAVRDSEERLSKGGVYLLETGLHLFLWVGASVQQEMLLNIFGTPSFSQIDPNLVRGNRSSLTFIYFINLCVQCVVIECFLADITHFFVCNYQSCVSVFNPIAPCFRQVCQCWITRTLSDSERSLTRSELSDHDT